MRVAYREEPCRTALNRVKGMPFAWSLNPYTGCAHRCTFCYVRAFEARADRPSDDGYGRSIRVKVNVAEVLRAELARRSWKQRERRDRSGDRPVPARRGPLPAHARVHPRARPRAHALLADHARAAGPARRRRPRRGGRPRDGARHVLRADARRADLACDRAGDGAAAATARDGAHPRRGRDRHGRRARAAAARPLRRPGAPRRGRARGAGGRGEWRLGERPLPAPGTREHFLEALARDWPELLPAYERLYDGRAYLPSRETDATRSLVRRLARDELGSAPPHAAPGAEPEQLVAGL